MTISAILWLAVGGLLVWLGMVGGAIADRIRYGKRSTHEREHEREREPRVARVRKAAVTGIAVSTAVTVVPMLSEVRDALVGLGWSKPQASEAAAEARRQIGDGAPLDVWIRKALQCCPRPAAS